MDSKQENKGLDRLIEQFVNKLISFDEVVFALKKRIHCIAWKAAKSYQRYKPLYDIDDYESIVRMALLKAIEKWNPARAGFATFFEKVAYSEINDIRKGLTAQSRQSNLDTYSWEADVLTREKNGIIFQDKGYKQVDFWLIYKQLNLTKRQDLICRMIIQGYKRKEIALYLGISEGAISLTLKRLRKAFQHYR